MLIGIRLRNPTARRSCTMCPPWPLSGGLVQSTSTSRRERLSWSCSPHQAGCCWLLLPSGRSPRPEDAAQAALSSSQVLSAALTLRKGQCRRRSLPRSLEALVALPQKARCIISLPRSVGRSCLAVHPRQRLTFNITVHLAVSRGRALSRQAKPL